MERSEQPFAGHRQESQARPPDEEGRDDQKTVVDFHELPFFRLRRAAGQAVSERHEGRAHRLCFVQPQVLEPGVTTASAARAHPHLRQSEDACQPRLYEVDRLNLREWHPDDPSAHEARSHVQRRALDRPGGHRPGDHAGGDRQHEKGDVDGVVGGTAPGEGRHGDVSEGEGGPSDAYHRRER
jgi:hypothetical protein